METSSADRTEPVTSTQAKERVQFTPGPWRYAEGRIYANGSHVIAEMHTQAEETIPNCRLIAAAPDMFFALLGLQVIAEQYTTDICDDVIARERQEFSPIDMMELRRWEAVGEAINKALGKQSRTEER